MNGVPTDPARLAARNRALVAAGQMMGAGAAAPVDPRVLAVRVAAARAAASARALVAARAMIAAGTAAATTADTGDREVEVEEKDPESEGGGY